ncbi:kelch repeat-containing protein [Planctomycetota bacterium]
MNTSDSYKKIKITFFVVGLVTAIVLTTAERAGAATWTQKADMPTPRWGHSVAVVNGKIYVIGGVTSETGFLNGQPIPAVEEYDPTTDIWTQKADMPEPRGYLYGSHPVVDGRIYVIGGGKTAVSRVDVYDPATDTWSRAADMSTPRMLYARVAWDEKIYTFGGMTGTLGSSSTTVNVTEVYDPQLDSWSQAAPMPTGVWEHSACVVDDKIYVIGGATATNSIQIFQVYDPMTDMWTNATPKPLNTRGFGATAVCGKIYTVGGWFNSGQTPFSQTWIYDTATDKWAAGVSLPENRATATLSIVNGKIYAMGGSPRPHNVQATSTVWEYDIEFTVQPDFNGDGIVDSADISMMVDYWGTDEPLYDIAPAPCGDGIVDVQDLIVVAEHLFEDYLAMPHWKLDEEAGNTAYDSLGVRDGTLHGEPLWQPTGGMIDGSLEFDGIDDYISTDFVLDPSLGAFSTFVWVKGGAPGQVIISQSGGTGNIWLGLDDPSGNLMTGLVSPSAGWVAKKPLVSESIISDDQWHQIGIVWDGSYRILYVDGIEVAKDTTAQNPLKPADGGIYIGADKTLGTSTYFSGFIDDVRIYNQTLTAEEIAALAQ